MDSGNPQNLVDFEAALETIFSRLPEPCTEPVEILESLGRVLGRDVVAENDQPSEDRAVMDGFALHSSAAARASASKPVRLRVSFRIGAGEERVRTLEKGACAEICTGAPLPGGADTVVPAESVAARGDEITLTSPAPAGSHVMARGGFFKRGDLLAPKGRIIQPEEVHVLASVGLSEVQTVQPPRVSIISTGSELVDVGQNTKAGQLWASNLYYLASYVRLAGAVIRDLDIVPDNLEKIVEAVGGSKAEVVITTGGTASGYKDLTREALRTIGAEILIDGISVSPGKSFLFAVAKGRPVFCFPGSPGDSRALAWILLNPVLRRMAGHSDWKPPEIAAVLESDLPAIRGLTKFVPAKVSRRPQGLLVKPVSTTGRDLYYPSMEVNGFLVIPADVDFLKSGYEVRVILTGNVDFVSEDEVY